MPSGLLRLWQHQATDGATSAHAEGTNWIPIQVWLMPIKLCIVGNVWRRPQHIFVGSSFLALWHIKRRRRHPLTLETPKASWFLQMTETSPDTNFQLSSR
jgi:hypothetical protein